MVYKHAEYSDEKFNQKSLKPQSNYSFCDTCTPMFHSGMPSNFHEYFKNLMPGP